VPGAQGAPQAAPRACSLATHQPTRLPHDKPSSRQPTSPQAAATTSSALQGAPQAAPRACSHQPTRLPSSRSCAVTTYPRLSLRRRAPTSALLPSGLPSSGAAGASSLDQLATPASSTFDCAHRPSARRRMYRRAACTPPTRQPQSDRSSPPVPSRRPPTRQPQSDRSYSRPRDDQQFQHCCARSRSPVLQPAAATRPPVPAKAAPRRAMHLRRRGPGAVQLCRCASVTSRR